MALRLSTGLRNYLARTGPLDTAMTLGFMYLFSGQQPTNADTAISSTQLLCAISLSGLGVTGIALEDASADGTIQIAAANTYSGAGITNGTVGFFRFQELDTNEATTRTNALAASTTTKRIDGTVAASGANLNTGNTSIRTGATQTLSSFTLTIPANA